LDPVARREDGEWASGVLGVAAVVRGSTGIVLLMAGCGSRGQFGVLRLAEMVYGRLVGYGRGFVCLGCWGFLIMSFVCLFSMWFGCVHYQLALCAI